MCDQRFSKYRAYLKDLPFWDKNHSISRNLVRFCCHILPLRCSILTFWVACTTGIFSWKLAKLHKNCMHRQNFTCTEQILHASVHTNPLKSSTVPKGCCLKVAYSLAGLNLKWKKLKLTNFFFLNRYFLTWFVSILWKKLFFFHFCRPMWSHICHKLDAPPPTHTCQIWFEYLLGTVAP